MGMALVMSMNKVHRSEETLSPQLAKQIGLKT
jgi:hypothetical protein